jgi:hypothetical protein
LCQSPGARQAVNLHAVHLKATGAPIEKIRDRPWPQSVILEVRGEPLLLEISISTTRNLVAPIQFF